MTSDTDTTLAGALIRLLDATSKLGEPKLSDRLRAEFAEARERAAKVLLLHAARNGEFRLPQLGVSTYLERWRRLRGRILKAKPKASEWPAAQEAAGEA